MRLNLAEFMILFDALTASLRISDGGTLYTYAKETRQQLWLALHDRMGHESGLEVGEMEEEKP